MRVMIDYIQSDWSLQYCKHEGINLHRVVDWVFSTQKYNVLLFVEFSLYQKLKWVLYLLSSFQLYKEFDRI